MTATGEVRLLGLTKRFDEQVAVDGIDATIEGGEFFSLLGPSGCGKTTTLRMIAGFERPTAGEILLDGVDVSSVPPHQRNVHTVFQNYALFPHLNVFDNVAFGLRRRKVGRAEVRQRVQESLALVELGDLGARKPNQLSGGQQQRVALARALVLRPAVLLLDEPLGALDAKIRKQLRLELKTLQEEVGITFVFVTHDQEEALSMSDRIAIFHRGRIEQIGTPADVYERPATAFVAGFVGTSNILEGTVAQAVLGELGPFTIRPEKIRMAEPGTAAAPGFVSAAGRVHDVVYLGSDTRYLVTLDAGGKLAVISQNVTTSSMEALALKDKAVSLTWYRRHTLPVAADAAAQGATKTEEVP